MWSVFCRSNVSKFESDLQTWLGTISSEDSVDKEQLAKHIDHIIREKRRITPLLTAEQFKNLKKNLNQKKQSILTKCSVIRENISCSNSW